MCCVCVCVWGGGGGEGWKGERVYASMLSSNFGILVRVYHPPEYAINCTIHSCLCSVTWSLYHGDLLPGHP